jgi:carbon-monoxide dehydrogenase medium subunit
MAGPNAFVLERPTSVDEVAAILAEYRDEARIMAGGQSLTPLLTLGLSAPSAIVSLDRCADLDRHEPAEGALHVGAMVTTSAFEGSSVHGFPLLAQASSRVGSPHVRNFGTVVGNVCHADPGGDLVPALLCHDTEVLLQSSAEVRTVSLDEFVTGPFATAISDSEFAVGIRIKCDAGEGWQHAYRKLVKRAGDLAVAACAVRLRCDGDTISEARITVGGALSRARRLRSVEAALQGATRDDAAAMVLDSRPVDEVEAELMPDITSPEEYLRMMLPRFIAATVAEATTSGGLDG